MTAQCPPHVLRLLTHLANCEIDENHPELHTTVTVLGCLRCQIVELYPARNAEKITPRYLALLRNDLSHEGWILR